jgi:hypothetical protein
MLRLFPIIRINVTLSALQHYLLEVRLSGNVNLNIKFGMKSSYKITTRHNQNAVGKFAFQNETTSADIL